MSWSYVDKARNYVYGTSASVTFAETPSDGELIVIVTAVAGSDQVVTGPSGFSSGLSQYIADFREVSVYYKIASSESGASYGISVPTDTDLILVGYRFTATGTIGVGNTDFDGDNTSVSTITSSITASSGSLLIGAGYNGAATSKTLKDASTADYSEVYQAAASGNGLRLVAGYKVTTGAGTESVTMTDGAANTRYTSWLVEFTEGTTTTKKLKLLAHSSAVGATGCTVEVFAEPSAGDLTGTKFGKATGQAWSAGTGADTGFAVMKIPVADFSGSALAVNDTPVALVENATYAAVRLADPYSIVIEE